MTVSVASDSGPTGPRNCELLKDVFEASQRSIEASQSGIEASQRGIEASGEGISSFSKRYLKALPETAVRAE